MEEGRALDSSTFPGRLHFSPVRVLGVGAQHRWGCPRARPPHMATGCPRGLTAPQPRTVLMGMARAGHGWSSSAPSPCPVPQHAPAPACLRDGAGTTRAQSLPSQPQQCKELPSSIPKPAGSQKQILPCRRNCTSEKQSRGRSKPASHPLLPKALAARGSWHPGKAVVGLEFPFQEEDAF